MAFSGDTALPKKHQPQLLVSTVVANILADVENRANKLAENPKLSPGFKEKLSLYKKCYEELLELQKILVQNYGKKETGAARLNKLAIEQRVLKFNTFLTAVGSSQEKMEILWGSLGPVCLYGKMMRVLETEVETSKLEILRLEKEVETVKLHLSQSKKEAETVKLHLSQIEEEIKTLELNISRIEKFKKTTLPDQSLFFKKKPNKKEENTFKPDVKADQTSRDTENLKEAKASLSAPVNESTNCVRETTPPTPTKKCTQ